MNSIDDISDSNISRLYRDSSDETSPSSLDQSVLALAREHAQIHNANKRLRKLTPRFAWAAVVVLTVGVVLSIQFGDYDDLSRSAAHSPTYQEAPSNRVDRLPAPSAKPKPNLERKIAPAPKMQPQTEFEPSSSSFAGAAPADREAEADQVSPMLSAPAAENKPLKRFASPAPSVAAPAPEPAARAREPVATLAPAAPTEKRLNQAPRLMLRAPAEKQPQSAAENSPLEAKLKAKSVAKSELSATQVDCSTLSQYACAISPSCVLTQSDNGLQCRAASERCERGFNQLSATAAMCQSDPVCRFFSGDCDCNESSGRCVCKDKGPARCQPNN